jgi:predicted metal-dependent peptidase
MIRRHDERAADLRAARDETDQKLAAVVDAQIRGEDEMTQLRATMTELAGVLTRLTEKVDAITGGGRRVLLARRGNRLS